ncbi:MAG: Phospholipase D1 [Watsoniomyces obsoletus]|nr:MAG: Phospholipase D1 [Watsoniomyces obsoletus]
MAQAQTSKVPAESETLSALQTTTTTSLDSSNALANPTETAGDDAGLPRSIPAKGAPAGEEVLLQVSGPPIEEQLETASVHGASSLPGQADGPPDVLSPPKPAHSHEPSTPAPRRSVQFVRSPLNLDGIEPVQTSHTFPKDEPDSVAVPRGHRGSAFFSKLRALAVPSGLPGHGRSQSGYTLGESSTEDGVHSQPLSPVTDRGGLRSPPALGGVEEDSHDTDADFEDSPVPHRIPPYFQRRPRHARRRSDEGPQTVPNTPRMLGHLGERHGQPAHASESAADGRRPHHFLHRRATITDFADDHRAGVSEDEGRDRLARESPWRPSFWRGSSQGGSEFRRPSNFRRLTTWGITSESAATTTPSSRRRALESNLSMSAARWRALKAGLKMMGQRRREEHKFDHAKSAELLAELSAGTPAALILASMFQRDDHGHKRIPVLLEQLKVKLTESKRYDGKIPGDRHQIFRIELEYGSGLTRMKWVIHRSLRDFTNLHVRYKLQSKSDKYKHLHGRDDPARQKLPRFPRTAFPFLRGVRGLGSEDEDENEEQDDEGTAETSNATPATSERRGKKKKKRRPFHLSSARRGSLPARSESYDASAQTPLETPMGASSVLGTPGARRETYHERQRKKLEQYLQQMIRHLMFRADSSRLCKFLELSSLGTRLAAEGGYHGKEGFLIIQSAKGLDFRKAWEASLVVRRHAPKWFLVRHSYVVCVDSPEEMNIYDVFLVDESFAFECRRGRFRDVNKLAQAKHNPKELVLSAKQSATRSQHHVLKLCNSERKLRLLAKNERQLLQFEESISFMIKHTLWSKPHRFNSFAPERSGVFVQWLVDGRDYMWNVSRSIAMARDVIYIHDWWLSPEIYLRRPAAISRRWRLDRLLQRKAREGVKIFVILYRNINSAIPIDSSYTKFSLLDLHPNIYVQRSPNQFRQNTFFWAHHEKILIVDHTVAFVGGIDLCFGRWDTPNHDVCDDKLTGFEQSDQPKDADHCQSWPGKDYSNPRVQDFYALDKPYEEMYDRTNVPRMPWHDISMQVVGQPARDLTRHFVQRWNYVLRQRKPTRPTPFLLPPPDINQAELKAMELDGTCDVQILRSCSSWSMGTPDKTEHSIMDAYVRSIEESEHFVYIENQFFISSCDMDGTLIENHIGDALVNRAIRAARLNEAWRAIILIPLMPGFQNTVDTQDGTSVRLIMQCQYRSICRGDSSIFARLHALDIEPEDYIQFYSLRSWGKIGPSKMLVTEQLYIHAKIMIVDDRVAIIGSANINERSMRGDRDSECAAIVRDTEMETSMMDGEPYQVGKFAHTLRMRLMREHLGINLETIRDPDADDEHHRDGHDDEDGNLGPRPTSADSRQTAEIDHETEQVIVASRHRVQDELIAQSEEVYSFNHDVDWEQANNPNVRSDKKKTEDKRVTGNLEHKKDVEGFGPDRMAEENDPAVIYGRDTVIVDGCREVLLVDVMKWGRKNPLTALQTNANGPAPVIDEKTETEAVSSDNASRHPPLQGRPRAQTAGKASKSPQSVQSPVEDNKEKDKEKEKEKGGPEAEGSPEHDKPAQVTAAFVQALIAEMKRPEVDQDCMKDPLSDAFYHDIWHAVAENNTKLFRYVFRCMPDNEVLNWKRYKEYAAYAERFAQAQGGAKSTVRQQQESTGRSGPSGTAFVSEKLASLPSIGEAVNGVGHKIESILEKSPTEKDSGGAGMGRVADWAEDADRAHHEREEKIGMPGEEGQVGSTAPPDLIDEKAAMKIKDATAGGGGGGGGDQSGETVIVKDVNNNDNTAPVVDGEKDKPEQQNRQSPPNSQPTESMPKNSTSQRRRRRGTTRSSRREFFGSDDLIGRAEAEELMGLVQGHLVLWPYDWLAKEEKGGNWLYSIDMLAPLEI